VFSFYSFLEALLKTGSGLGYSLKTLLVNWVYAGALGHAVEAFKQANSFKNGNPDFQVSVMINAEVGVELGNCIE
jgi:hypothetical protein